MKTIPSLFRFGSLALLTVSLATPACTSHEEVAADPKARVEPGFAGDVEGFDLADYRGRVVVLNFWATWCGPCRIEIPALVRLRRDFKEEGAIIGISLDQGSAEQVEPLIDRFVARYEINYPIYLDAEQKIAGDYEPGSRYMRLVPTTVVIDQRGEIVKTHQGVPSNARGIDPYGVLATEIQALLDDA